jgi:hypothetical protein
LAEERPLFALAGLWTQLLVARRDVDSWPLATLELRARAVGPQKVEGVV